MTMLNMLILVTGYYPAKMYGGPASSIQNLAVLLENFCRFYIVTRNHDLHDSRRLGGIQDGWFARKECEIIYLAESKMTANGIAEAAKSCGVKFDAVFSQSFFDHSLNFAGKKVSEEFGIPFLIAPRGELCPGAFRFKRWKKVPYTAFWKHYYNKALTYFFSTSDEEHREIATKLDVSDGRIFQIPNVPSIGSGHGRSIPKKRGMARFIYLSRIHPKKNLRFGIEALARSGIDAQLDVYGPIEDEAYWGSCLAKATKSSTLRVEYKGLVDHEKAIDTFSGYDAFLFPTLSENYGHVIAEALAAGCPVIASDQTPWTPLNEAGAGWALPLSDEESFVAVMRGLADMDDVAWRKMSSAARDYAVKATDLPGLKRQYLDMFYKIVE